MVGSPPSVGLVQPDSLYGVTQESFKVLETGQIQGITLSITSPRRYGISLVSLPNTGLEILRILFQITPRGGPGFSISCPGFQLGLRASTRFTGPPHIFIPGGRERTTSMTQIQSQAKKVPPPKKPYSERVSPYSTRPARSPKPPAGRTSHRPAPQ